ncbi:protein lifeguard 1-like [Lepisosteus oculatus]|uniref:protein lifeguard 1-like n=1 Tax=Lepisosteus oculatus TaxID=7918 RepID=UPI0037249E21
MEESQIRRGDYIRKVFSVLTVQLLAILSVLCLLLLCEPLKEFVKTNLWISLNSYLIFILVSAVLLFCLSCRRAVPRGTPGMRVMTLCMSCIVSTVAAFHSVPAVAVALGCTLAISSAVFVCTTQTFLGSCSSSSWGGALLLLLLVSVVLGFISGVWYSSTLGFVFSSLGTLLFSMCLAEDSQAVLSTEPTDTSLEEHSFAALVLSLDISMIFIYLLLLSD